MLSLTGLVTRNWTLKLSAFGLALLLWVMVRVEAPTVQDIPGIPVRVTLSDPAWALVGDPAPATVTVRFEGPSRELIRIAMERPTLSIPLDLVTSGDTVVTLNPAWLPMQGRQGVFPGEILPSTVRVLLEPIERKAVPPALRFEGALPDTLALVLPPLVDPAEVRVGGPRSRLHALDSIPVFPIDLATISATGVVAAQVDTTVLSGLQILPLDLDVHFQVEGRGFVTVADIPIHLPGSLRQEGGYQLGISTASAELQGARSLLGGFATSGLEFVVDTAGAPLPGLGESREYPIRLDGLPPLLSGDPRPSVVTVRNVGEAAP